MLDSLHASLGALFSLSGLIYLVIGVIFGLIVGVLPGLGGMFALSMLLPVTLELDQYSALALLIGTYAATPAGGSITAILFGVPGTVSSAATVIDGFEMSKQGKSGEAIGAALMSSAAGGVIGALILFALVPVLRQVVLSFGPAEMVMLTLLGVSFVGMLGGESGVAKSWIAGCLGLFLATVRLDLTGAERFTFGIVPLWDGFPLIAVVLGLFAIAEMIELSKADTPFNAGKQVGHSAFQGMLQGAKTTLKKISLVTRCSAIGALIGIIPGLGGETAIFLAYGHAAQSSKEKHKFGHGSIEGVIGPESANNAKEGGALVPTIGLGVPGSAMMAMFLGAFLVMGLYPGPGMLLHNLDVVLVMIWALILASILASLLAAIGCLPLIRLVYWLKTSWLAGGVVVLASYGVYVGRSLLIDLAILVVFGLIGIFMKLYDFPRAGLLVGFVLGNILEKNTQQAYGIYGWTFFLQPLSLVILAVIIAGMVYPIIKKRRQGEQATPKKERGIGIAFIVLFGFIMAYSLMALKVPSLIAPLIVSSIGLCVSLVYFLTSSWGDAYGRESRIRKADGMLILSLALFILCVFVFGFHAAAVLFMIFYLILVKKEKALTGVLATVCIIAFLYAIGMTFDVELPEGLLPALL